ncbi:hypothetical protein yberc0001_15670 [Yersinia bercovieri ATCC 43970]|uniref:Uncharacterized protein n=1 Tax=Yersinia bercovieri ATCC 43970 TaxID=349968 RepID=A0ABM9XXJ1_YERBE|nr:hypothetical protein yberc0001_15670 [Yersinia bercovieri ATCC 43970]
MDFHQLKAILGNNNNFIICDLIAEIEFITVFTQQSSLVTSILHVA